MLVYCTSIWLNADWDTILDAIAYWFDHKVPRSITADDLARTGDIHSSSHEINVIHARSEYPQLVGIRYTHPDTQTSGRQWITEIGLKQEIPGNVIQCSVLVRTSEISPRVDRQVETTRPWLVSHLVSTCDPSWRTPGRDVIPIDEAEAVKVWQRIDDPEREHPLIIISPTYRGDYLVNAQSIHSKVVGMADVFKIVSQADTYAIEEILTGQFAAYNGAVNIVFPRSTPDDDHIPNTRLLHETLQALEASGGTTQEILSLVTHRMNLRNYWQHTQYDEVIRVQKHRELENRITEAAEESEIIHLYDAENRLIMDENSSLQQQNEALTAEISALKADLSDRDDQINNLKQINRQLKVAKHYAHSQTTDSALPSDFIELLIHMMNETITPEQSLKFVATVFPERVLVLDSAYKSAQDSAIFSNRPYYVFKLLWQLVTDYWEAMVEGKGDLEGKEIFGMNVFAARESESVEHNRRARQLRTFTYKGQPIEMMKHLRIGRKDSVAETMRIHFHWDDAQQVIVIGHCGRHLDHK